MADDHLEQPGPPNSAWPHIFAYRLQVKIKRDIKAHIEKTTTLKDNVPAGTQNWVVIALIFPFLSVRLTLIPLYVMRETLEYCIQNKTSKTINMGTSDMLEK